ncbi:MAG: hypothetical protein CVT81_12160 [Alphaproteobacteria bacterium HGW-Alphaproteobacteria-3]|nr:MAG: hypothetical protein CVT81_12160 [Alphaproteobacteria bacterium HGW-Alphaproteobacteria-3]
MTGDLPAEVYALIGAELSEPSIAEAHLVAGAIRAKHGPAVRAILFYGSCRRARTADGILDFYVLVDRYRAYHEKIGPSSMNRLLPPTVTFMRVGPSSAEVAAKVAVISLDQFARRMRRTAIDTTLWARFAQPATLVYAADAAARQCVVEALGDAADTAAGWARRLVPSMRTYAELWTGLFTLTYGAELRSERGDRPLRIYEHDAARYDAIASALRVPLDEAGVRRIPLRSRAAWAFRRIAGKALSLARLAKAAFTFEGGVDYVVWKIERHSGISLTVTPWQRRHPILAAPFLLLSLYRKGAIS